MVAETETEQIQNDGKSAKKSSPTIQFGYKYSQQQKPLNIFKIRQEISIRFALFSYFFTLCGNRNNEGQNHGFWWPSDTCPRVERRVLISCLSNLAISLVLPRYKIASSVDFPVSGFTGSWRKNVVKKSPKGRRTVGQINQEYRLQYWATRSSVCLSAHAAHTAHLFACSALLSPLARSAALICSLACSLTPEWLFFL